MTQPLGTCALAVGAVALVAGVVRADVAGTTQQLGALAGSTQTAPAISGTGVVWTNLTGTNFDIFYQDVSMGSAPVNLTNTPGENEFLEDIDKDAVVWIHTGNGSDGDIVLYDTSTNQKAIVAASTSSVHFAHPAISGNYVVFERITATQVDIDVYDRTIGGSPGPQVTNDAAMQAHPRVSGDLVVYEDYSDPSGAAAVYGYHVLTSGPAFLIAKPARWPDVDGNNVVYVGSDAAGNDQIYLYDLTTGSARALTTAASSKMMPRISGSRVVWTDNRNGDDDVYSYDLTTGSEALLAGGPGSQSTGDISGDRVVYSGPDAAGNDAVWLFTYAGAPPDPLPEGCDPAKTDLVDGPVSLSEPARRPVGTVQHFAATAGRRYFVCVENGLPDGTERSSHVIVTVDGEVVLTPSDFKPNANPPAHVAQALDLDHEAQNHKNGQHEWAASLFAQPDTTVRVSIRVAK